MKIGIDARFIGPSGTGLGKYTEKLIENLQKIDKQNNYTIFLNEDNWTYLKLKEKNFQKCLANVPWYSIEEQLKLPRIFKGASLDLLHVPHFNVPIFYREKFVVTIHDLIHHYFSQESATTKNRITHKIKRFAYKRTIENAVKKSRNIIVPSNYVKEDILKNFQIPSEKITVTYESAEEEYFQEPVKKENFLLYVGNTYPHKNIKNLLLAMKVLENLSLKIVCPRDVFHKRLQEQINNLKLDSKVSLISFTKTDDLKKLFRKAKAYVFPTLSEGFGIPGLNAMASSLPVICSDIPTLKEIYENAALYFDPNNPKDIAQKIQKIINDEILEKKLIEAGKIQVKKFSWEKMAEETLGIYKYTNSN